EYGTRPNRTYAIPLKAVRRSAKGCAGFNSTRLRKSLSTRTSDINRKSHFGHNYSAQVPAAGVICDSYHPINGKYWTTHTVRFTVRAKGRHFDARVAEGIFRPISSREVNHGRRHIRIPSRVRAIR